MTASPALIASLAGLALCAGCRPEPPHTRDPRLVGRWKPLGTLKGYQFNSDGTGWHYDPEGTAELGPPLGWGVWDGRLVFVSVGEEGERTRLEPLEYAVSPDGRTLIIQSRERRHDVDRFVREPSGP